MSISETSARIANQAAHDLSTQLLSVKAFAIVMLGGAIGSALRFGISIWLRRFDAFPWATFTANIVGCFAFGVVAAVLAHRPSLMGLFLLTGVLGGFTTFSSFGYELFVLLERGAKGAAVLYVSASLIGGLIAVWAAMRMTNALT